MTRVAAIDCGTNSIRLLIADVVDGEKTDVRREMRIVRLGQGVDQTGRLAAEAIERTIAACREYQQIITELGAERIAFAATSATRDAQNSADFSDAVFEVLGVRPRVLTGEQEARASFLGAASEFANGSTMVIDIGGGSTEFVQGSIDAESAMPDFAQSVNLGCVRMTERFLKSNPPVPDEIADCSAAIDELISPVLEAVAETDTLVFVAGTATTIAAHILGLSEYDSEKIHGSRFAFAQYREAAQSLLAMTVTERRELGFMHPGRADVIGGGSLIVERILSQVRSSNSQLLVSEHDILDGIAMTADDFDG